MRKYIKIFEQFKSHQKIKDICIKYGIENYTINDDMSIDVDGSVDLSGLKLKKLPLKFRNVTGYFDCGRNILTSLEGSPNKIGSTFYCNNNKLTSLDGAPEEINGSFYCHNNKLTSLEGSPIKVKGVFNCVNNELISLKGMPISITEWFDCGNNPLYSFEYFPNFVGSELLLPIKLNYIFNLFDYNRELIDAFNDYNIIKAPKSSDDKPRLKLSNLNSFLSDNGFKELDDTSELEKYYDLK